MASTAPLDQRYMRALAHIPLLSLERPERVLVIGFGVGNTTHAATMHSSVTRVDVADVSRNILEPATYFREANHEVLRDRKVSVFVNDGRQHLQMMPPASYDLITLVILSLAFKLVLPTVELNALLEMWLGPMFFLSNPVRT